MTKAANTLQWTCVCECNIWNISCLHCFFPKDMFAGILTLGFGLKVETWNAMADVGLLTFGNPASMQHLPACTKGSQACFSCLSVCIICQHVSIVCWHMATVCILDDKRPDCLYIQVIQNESSTQPKFYRYIMNNYLHLC